VPSVLALKETDVILVTLSLLDLTLVLTMVFASYENFVSRIDIGDDHRPSWMGTLGFGGLKLKLISSIVAISGIDLLKVLMNIGQISKDDLMWKVVDRAISQWSTPETALRYAESFVTLIGDYFNELYESTVSVGEGQKGHALTSTAS